MKKNIRGVGFSHGFPIQKGMSRRSFLRAVGIAGLGLGAALGQILGKAREIFPSRVVWVYQTEGIFADAARPPAGRINTQSMGQSESK